MKSKIIGALCFAVLAAPVHAASKPPPASIAAVTAGTLKSEDEVAAFADRVMQAVSRGDLDAAYRALKNYSVLPGDDVDRGLQASRQQRAAPLFAQRFGATVGSEFIGRKKLGQSMLRLTYIERTQKQPLPWAFYFYLTSNGWVLSEFGWSAQPAALYDAN